MSELEWTSEMSIRLMQEYKHHPELWDTNHDLYRVQTAKYDAWAQLAQLFDCDIADLRKKLNSLFASHRREKAKIREGGRSTWFLYKHMSFLPNHLENNERVEVLLNENQETDPDMASDVDDGPEDNNIMVKQEPGVPMKPHESRQYITPPRPKAKVMRQLLKRKVTRETPQKETASQLDSRLLETLRLLRKSDLSKKKDECDTFGEYIAMSLRKHDERTQSMIKQAINNILFEQEMKKFSSSQYTVILNDPDENPLVLADHEDK